MKITEQHQTNDERSDITINDQYDAVEFKYRNIHEKEKTRRKFYYKLVGRSRCANVLKTVDFLFIYFLIRTSSRRSVESCCDSQECASDCPAAYGREVPRSGAVRYRAYDIADFAVTGSATVTATTAILSETRTRHVNDFASGPYGETTCTT